MGTVCCIFNATITFVFRQCLPSCNHSNTNPRITITLTFTSPHTTLRMLRPSNGPAVVGVPKKNRPSRLSANCFILPGRCARKNRGSYRSFVSAHAYT